MRVKRNYFRGERVRNM